MPKQRRGDLTSTPHDALIKYTFSQREHATGLLKAALPPEAAALIDWSTLTLTKIHFVDRSLRGRYADLLFSADIGEDRIHVYVLVEHQSKVEPLMMFRMGSYMWRHWEQLVRDDPTRESLPAILPILIHHSDTGWTASTTFQDLIAAPEAARASMRPYIPRFRMKLIDVSRDPSGGLVKQALTDLGRVVLWCLSVAGDDRRLEGEIDHLVAELNALYAAPDLLDALIAVVRYLVATHAKLDANEITKLVEKTARKGQKEIDMDVFDQAELKGRRQGKVEGKRDGKCEVLLDLLAARFGDVPADAKAKILAADDPTLSRWSLRVLTAKTLDAVLDDAAPPKKPAAAAKRRSAATKRPAAPKRA